MFYKYLSYEKDPGLPGEADCGFRAKNVHDESGASFHTRHPGDWQRHLGPCQNSEKLLLARMNINKNSNSNGLELYN